MASIRKYFVDHNPLGELNNRVILNDIRKAENEYKCGVLSSCREKLKAIVAAIECYENGDDSL